MEQRLIELNHLKKELNNELGNLENKKIIYGELQIELDNEINKECVIDNFIDYDKNNDTTENQITTFFNSFNKLNYIDEIIIETRKILQSIKEENEEYNDKYDKLTEEIKRLKINNADKINHYQEINKNIKIINKYYKFPIFEYQQDTKEKEEIYNDLDL